MFVHLLELYSTSEIVGNHLVQIEHHPVIKQEIHQPPVLLIQFQQVLKIMLLFAAVLEIHKFERHSHLQKIVNHHDVVRLRIHHGRVLYSDFLLFFSR